MKKSISHIIQKIVKLDFVWKGVYPLVKTANYLQYQRKISRNEIYKQELDRNFIQLLREPIVKHGPFAGLKYPDFHSYGSALFPKLLGSYESELHPTIEYICSKNYSVILDIGSAEGYYAIGFALRFRDTPVFAYDIDEEANYACENMARLNNVTPYVKVQKRCLPKTLELFDFADGGLIICDCEGYEKTVFTRDNLTNLAQCDLLIETHDSLDIEISDYLKQLFADSHRITSIYSIDDIAKARTYYFSEIEHLSLADKRTLLEEKRPAIMEWLYLEPKKTRA